MKPNKVETECMNMKFNSVSLILHLILTENSIYSIHIQFSQLEFSSYNSDSVYSDRYPCY